MKSEIKLYDKDNNFIKVFEDVKECANFFDKDKNYIYYNLRYMDKIRKDGKWYKIRRIVTDEKQQVIDRLNNIINGIEAYCNMAITMNFNMNNSKLQEQIVEDYTNVLNKLKELKEE